MSEISGKNILVLGGSRGIGAAIVRRFTSEGAKVAFTYFGSEAAARTLERQSGAEAVKADSADRAAQTEAIAACGPLDVLIINAGMGIFGDPLSLDPDAVDRLLDVNLRAPYHAAVEGARHMNADGRIIVIGSVHGDRIPFPGLSAYSLTKSGLQGMVRGLARDFGDRRITVNAIQPGPTDTDMNPADGPMAEAMHSFMAIKRHARPEEIAELVAYVASPHAAMITGSMLTIDGGFGA